MTNKAEILKPAAQVQIKNEYNQLLEQAVERGVDADALEKLVSLAWKQQDRIAAQEFNAAMKTFQEKVPAIIKTAEAKFATRNGGNMSYSYAPLEQVIKQVRPLLSELGLSFGWDSIVENNFLTVTCTLRHVNGHEQSAKFATAVDGSPTMSSPQKHASTLTFAKRYSLMEVLGIHAEDHDGAEPQDVEKITEDQVCQLDSLISDSKSDIKKFNQFFGVTKLEDIPRSRYKEAVEMLERKMRL